jgi:endoglucanase
MKIRRRDFNKASGLMVALVLTGCGGGGGGAPAAAPTPVGNTPDPVPPAPAPAPAPAPGPAPSPAPSPAPAPTPAPAPAPTPAPQPPNSSLALGANLVGMESAAGGVRYGQGTQLNVHWTPPRAADIQWLAKNGYNKNRLPIQWEMLQPVLFDTNVNAATRSIVGEPGAFNARYQAAVTAVLDAHAAAGTKCFLDLHNYCRYQDFRYQPDGSVAGLVKPADPGIAPYTTDADQVYTRIFATAAGATLKPAHLADFWTRATKLWKDHPGFGGYGLMNEPYFMPAPGGLVPTSDGSQDLTIWPTFAKAAIEAIRALDPTNTIYVDGNDWSGAFTFPASNPQFPLNYPNLVYQVHMYLDAASNGQRFDYDVEAAKKFSVGEGAVSINPDTGWHRLKTAVDWAAQKGAKLALSETGMPIGDARWQEMFQRLVDYARSNGVEIYVWNGGSFWPVRNSSMNFVPGWHQDRTMEPEASGVLKKSANIAGATLFDDGPGYVTGGTAATITLYARGYLAAPVTVGIASNSGGSLSASSVTLPAGANSQVSFTLTPAQDRVTTLTYTAAAGISAPPPRTVYSIIDPVSYAVTNLADAARALIAKYSAAKWEAADGYTDYELGAPASAGQQVRAIADTGWGSSICNTMEMLNWMYTDLPSATNLPPPVMRMVNGRKCTDHSAPSSSGFWCRKTFRLDEMQPRAKNVVPYTMADPHFMMAAVSAPSGSNGVVFQASRSLDTFASQLVIANGVVQATAADSGGVSVNLRGNALTPDTPAVLTFTSAPGAQRLRVNANQVATGAATFSATQLDQMLIGWGFQNYYPVQGFGGLMYSAISGKGSPTAAELRVMEQYLAGTAGLAL